MECVLLDRFVISAYGAVAHQIEPPPFTLQHTCARPLDCLASASLLGFVRRCRLARAAAPASNLDSLQGTLKKLLPASPFPLIVERIAVYIHSRAVPIRRRSSSSPKLLRIFESPLPFGRGVHRSSILKAPNGFQHLASEQRYLSTRLRYKTLSRMNFQLQKTSEVYTVAFLPTAVREKPQFPRCMVFGRQFLLHHPLKDTVQTGRGRS